MVAHGDDRFSPVVESRMKLPGEYYDLSTLSGRGVDEGPRAARGAMRSRAVLRAAGGWHDYAITCSRSCRAISTACDIVVARAHLVRGGVTIK